MSRLPGMPTATLDNRARQSLRLDPKVWSQIDVARRKRPGNVSRNTWITEAILEKVERESRAGDIPVTGDGRRA
jgi:hypothetical protein